MKQGIPFWVWRKVDGNWDNEIIRISQWRESHFRKNTIVRRKKQIQKSKTVGVRDPSRNVYQLSKVIWPKLVTQSLWWTLKFPKSNTLEDGLIEKMPSMLDGMESKTMHNKDKENDQKRKKK